MLLTAKIKNHSNTNKIVKTLGDNFDMYIAPAVKENNRVHGGRGKGGLVTLWRKELTKYVSQIKSDNFRIQATKFSFPGGHLLLFNLYLPCDNGLQSHDDQELQQVLAEIRRIIDTANCHNCLLAGDLNCDFARQSGFVRTIRNFIETMGLVTFWTNGENENISEVDYTHTTINNRVSYYSKIDHFVSNLRVYNAVQEASVIHSGQNLSDHCPIYCKFNAGDLDVSLENETKRNVPSWKKATDDDKNTYNQVLAEKLSQVAIPECINCQDVHCTGDDHREQLEVYCTSVLEAVDTAAKDCLPATGGNVRKDDSRGKQGWNQFVKPFQKDSKFWSAVWQSAGRPGAGALYDVMRHTKSQYLSLIHI